jgi:hypothetical protein
MCRAPEPDIETIRGYLEREFPGQLQRIWWDGEAMAHVFEVVHETAHHQVGVPAAFIQTCDDAIASLHASELTDYMREARAQDRRFLVNDEGHTVRVRSTPL